MTHPFDSRLRIRTDYVAALAVTLAPIVYFLPAIRSGDVLCPDDGIIFNVPLRVAAAQIARSGHLPLWNPYIFGGMPLFAAAQGGLLFPLNWFFLFFSPAVATNLLVVSAYMIAALGAYLYARRAGASIAGAVTTSVIFQFSGYLIGQISHINIVQTMAMLPWVLWAVDGYAGSGSRMRGALLAGLIALQAFVGHQQTFAYSLMLVSAYAIVMAFAQAQTRARYFRSLAFVTAGVLLAAVQIVPTFELLRNSPRATATYDFFTFFSMPPRSVMAFLFPYFMGGGDGRFFRAPYIGPPFYPDYVGYAGVLAIMLVALAFLFKPDTRTKFWAVAGLVCLVLAFGAYAPLNIYRLIYHVPILNLFRVPARHLMEVQFAIAVLAGRGLTALEAVRGNGRALRRVAIVGAFLLLLTCLAVTWGRPSNFRLGREASVSVLRAPELFMPILFAAASAWALWVFARRRRGATVLLLTILVIDLVIWGQSSGWYTSSPKTNEEIWRVPETVQFLRGGAPNDPASYRILTAPHAFDPAIPPVPPSVSNSTDWVLWTQPDVYMMYGIQNAAGYDGFGLERYSHLAGEMKVWGELTDPDATLRGDSRAMDLLNVRYLLSMRPQTDQQKAGSTSALATAFPPATEQYGGFMFAQSDLSLPDLGANKRLRFTITPVEADHAALLTNLSWSEKAPDNAIVGRLRLTTKDGRSFEFPLRAGVDTAEWAYDRPDIRARIRHKRAAVATSYAVNDAQVSYEGHAYVTSFVLPEKVAIAAGEIVVEPGPQWPELLLSVFRVSLVNASENQTFPLSREWVRVESTNTPSDSPRPGESKSDRWKLLTRTSWVDIYENTKALPRTWLASNVRVLDERAMLETIRTGALPDGAKWDPMQTALVEAEPPNSLKTGASNGHAEITKYDPTRVELRTDSNGDSILMLSENHYPGWRAYLDDRGVDVMRVDYNLRGVFVPAGHHEVTFIYRPKSVMIGLLISMLTAMALVILSFRVLPQRWSQRIGA